MKTPEEFLNEVSKEYKQEDFDYAVKNIVPSYIKVICVEAMKRYSACVTREAVTNMYKEKESECESLRETLRNVIDIKSKCACCNCPDCSGRSVIG